MDQLADVTPRADALAILSQVSSSRLGVSQPVALAGDLPLFWDFTRFYSLLGCSSNPLVLRCSASLLDRALSMSFSRADFGSRAAAGQPSAPLQLTRQPSTLVCPVSAARAEPSPQARRPEGGSAESAANAAALADALPSDYQRAGYPGLADGAAAADAAHADAAAGAGTGTASAAGPAPES